MERAATLGADEAATGFSEITPGLGYWVRCVLLRVVGRSLDYSPLRRLVAESKVPEVCAQAACGKSVSEAARGRPATARPAH